MLLWSSEGTLNWYRCFDSVEPCLRVINVIEALEVLGCCRIRALLQIGDLFLQELTLLLLNPIFLSFLMCVVALLHLNLLLALNAQDLLFQLPFLVLKLAFLRPGLLATGPSHLCILDLPLFLLDFGLEPLPLGFLRLSVCLPHPVHLLLFDLLEHLNLRNLLLILNQLLLSLFFLLDCLPLLVIVLHR